MMDYCREPMVFQKYINQFLSESQLLLLTVHYMHIVATFSQKIISTSIPIAPRHMDNSFDLVENLINIYIDEDFSLIFLNVVSSFINISIDWAIKSLTDRWNFFSVCNIRKDEFLTVRFVLESTYFSFDQIYKQKFGYSIGSPFSLIIVDIVMQILERGVLGTFDFDISFYYKYT